MDYFEIVPQIAYRLTGMVDFRLFLGHFQMQFFLEKDFYIFLDFFCVLFGADNADYKIIGVTVVLDFLEAFLKRIVIVLIHLLPSGILKFFYQFRS